MNEFISPQQNININISYNLAQTKSPEVVFGKKVQKNVKAKFKETSTLSGDTQFRGIKGKYQPQKLKNTDILNITKEHKQSVNCSNEYKKSSKKKNKPKLSKKQHFVTYADFDNYVHEPNNNRRLKTEGSLNTYELTGKKQGKTYQKQSYSTQKSSSNHFKSTTLSQSNNKKINRLNIEGKAQDRSKQKKKHKFPNKSSIFMKKQRIGNAEHIVSLNTYAVHQNSITTTNKKKQRSNSAHLIKGDKLVNNLLDMSLLTSELGNSIVGKEEKNKIGDWINEQKDSKRLTDNFKEYMNSIDLRVMQNMQKDSRIEEAIKDSSYAKFTNQKLGASSEFSKGEGIELIAYLSKIRRISMSKLERCAIKIQRYWRKKTKQTLVLYYSTLFRNATTAAAYNSKDISHTYYRQDPEDYELTKKIKSDLRELYEFEEQSSNSEHTPHQNQQDSEIKPSLHKNDSEFSASDSANQISSPTTNNIPPQKTASKQYKQLSLQKKDQHQLSQNNHRKYVRNYLEVIHGKTHYPSSGDINEVDEKISQKVSEESDVDSKQLVKKNLGKNFYNYFNQHENKSIPNDSSLIKNKQYDVFEINSKQLEEYECQSDSSEEQWSSYQKQQRSLHHQNTKSLNIEKYRELAKKTIEKQKDESQFISKIRQKGKEQSLSKSVDHDSSNQSEEQRSSNQLSNHEQVKHWNEVNKMLTNSMQEKIPTLPKTIIEELMKQSTYNKQWADSNFSNEQSERITVIENKQIDSKNKNIEEKQDNQQQFESVKDQYWGQVQFIQNASDHLQNKQQQIKEGKCLEDNEESFEEEQPPSYNWHKYSELTKVQNFTSGEISEKLSCLKKQNKTQLELPKGIIRPEQDSNQHREQEQSEDEAGGISPDSKWINQQIKMENSLVQKYLDCGLDHFGLRIQEIANRHTNSSNNQNTDQLIFSNEQGDPNNQDDSDEKVFVFAHGADKKNGESAQSSHQDSHESVLQDRQDKRENQVNHIEEEQPGDQIDYEIEILKKGKVAQNILMALMEELTFDISGILKKAQDYTENSQSNHPQSPIKNKIINKQSIQTKEKTRTLNNSGFLTTNFQYIREFITQLKTFILRNQQYIDKVVTNIKNNIGPTSLEILSYLRMDMEGEEEGQSTEENDQNQQQWLFVIPNQLFEVFHKERVEQRQKNLKKTFSKKMLLYTQFWHRGIFECYNQCLDYQRPFGISGSPYAWIVEPKLAEIIKKQKISQILENAEERILEMSCSKSGIIFDKPDSPYNELDIDEYAKSQLNQDRISRMLATQILDDEDNWISYNDQVTEIMVEISRRIEQTLVFQLCTELKRVSRRRRNWLQQDIHEGGQTNQSAVFQLDQL